MIITRINGLTSFFHFSGTKGSRGKPGIRGNPGHFAMKFVNLRQRSRKPVFVVLPRDNHKYSFHVDTLKVNLRKGSITISPEETDVVQHMALAFVTTTLYLLVQPRPENPNVQIKRGEKKVLMCVLYPCHVSCRSAEDSPSYATVLSTAHGVHYDLDDE